MNSEIRKIGTIAASIEGEVIDTILYYDGDDRDFILCDVLEYEGKDKFYTINDLITALKKLEEKYKLPKKEYTFIKTCLYKADVGDLIKIVFL